MFLLQEQFTRLIKNNMLPTLQIVINKRGLEL